MFAKNIFKQLFLIFFKNNPNDPKIIFRENLYINKCEICDRIIHDCRRPA